MNAKPLLKDGTLSVDGKDALRGVPENVVVTPFTASSAFIGASCADASSRFVFKLGVIQYSFFSSVVSDSKWKKKINVYLKTVQLHCMMNPIITIISAICTSARILDKLFC